MGPETLLSKAISHQDTNPMNPPKIVTGTTSKMIYRDTLRRWIRMINGCAEVDTKHKAILPSAGHIVYMACSDLSKELLKQREKSGLLNMDGDADDTTRTNLMESIVDTIAKDTPNEAVIREVGSLPDIQMCQRNGNETVPTFVGRHKGAIARYVNQTAELTEFTDRQFAIIMMRNAKLTSHTMNALTFQLTTNSNAGKRAGSQVELLMTDKEAGYVENLLSNSARPQDECAGNIARTIEMARQKASERTGCIFNMEDVAQSLYQVKSEIIPENTARQVASLLGKQRPAHVPQDSEDQI